MLEIKELYEAKYPNNQLTINFGSSGSLQHQIEKGSPVDVFMSASQSKMQNLEEKNLIVDPSKNNLLENKLVLIVPKSSLKIKGFSDLTSDDIEKFAIGEPDSVPAGRYAKEVLDSLNLFILLSENMVYGKNVKEVLTWVETGNVDGGIVYETDAMTTDDVKIVEWAKASAHTPIIYPVAIIQDSKKKELAQSFIDFLYTDDVKKVFESYGFHMIN